MPQRGGMHHMSAASHQTVFWAAITSPSPAVVLIHKSPCTCAALQAEGGPHSLWAVPSVPLMYMHTTKKARC